MRRLTVKGLRQCGRLYIAIPKRYINQIPPYFIIEIDLGKISKREKEHNKSRKELK